MSKRTTKQRRAARRRKFCQKVELIRSLNNQFWGKPMPVLELHPEFARLIDTILIQPRSNAHT